MRQERSSLLIWCLICAVVVCIFLPTFMQEEYSQLDRQREPFVALIKYWEISFATEWPDEDDWKPFDSEARAALVGYEGTVWLQRSLPELSWRNPYLFFSLMNRFEIYLDGNPLFQFNMDRAFKYFNPLKSMHPVPVSPQDEGKTLLIRTEWEGSALFGNDLVLAGEPDQIWYALIQSELAYIVYSILGLTAGIVGAVMFIRRREALYGWFSLFCTFIGSAFLLSCRSLQWFIPMQEMYYWQELMTPTAIWACIGFYASVLGISKRRLFKGAHYSMVLYLFIALLVAILYPQLFFKLAADANTLVAFASFALITYSLIQQSRESSERGMAVKFGQGQVRLWLMRGYFTFTLCAVASLGAYMKPTFITELLNTRPYLYRIIEGLLPNGLLLFMICMVMVMVSRVRLIHQEAERNGWELMEKNKELEKFHRNLEQLVETRTAELEQANRNLALSLREKAETLAEISVLEERNRIAYEIHDVVGHTLTAAIVQIEATKKMADRQGEISREKMDLLSDLVRKGLNDIRKAVRLMKVDEEPPTLTLEASLKELIQYTEDTMDIKIEAVISLQPELGLGRLTERVLYHALQEGLTNSIRHGKCNYVRFFIHTTDKMLKFRLISDGEPFGSAVPGFGLSSMMERVELLGGEVSIHSSTDMNGDPEGCELAINLPLN